MPAIYASLTVFILLRSDRVRDLRRHLRQPSPVRRTHDRDRRQDARRLRKSRRSRDGSDSFANSLFRWVAKRLPEPAHEHARSARSWRRRWCAPVFPAPRAVRIFHFTRLASTAGIAFAALARIGCVRLHGIKPLGLMLVGAGVGAFVPELLRRPQGPEASAGNREPALRRSGFAGGLRRGRPRPQRGDQDRRLRNGTPEPDNRHRAIDGLGRARRRQHARPGAQKFRRSHRGRRHQAARRDLGPERKARRANRPRAALDFRHACARRAGSAPKKVPPKTTVKILFPLVLFILPAMMSVIVGPAMIQIMRALTSVHA